MLGTNIKIKFKYLEPALAPTTSAVEGVVAAAVAALAKKILILNRV